MSSLEGKLTVGPYHVLETLEESAGSEWLLGYDLRLLRKVWIRQVPPGTPAVPATLRNIGRVGRLRWLTGKRTTEENWDAFEAITGKPLLTLAQTRQPWSQVRFWLYDLATEISAGEKDGTLPELCLDRVWITGDGRAKLLDFPLPALPANTFAGLQHADMTHSTPNPHQFLGSVATVALGGRQVERNSSVKNYSLFIRLIAELKITYPNLKCKLVGNGPELATLKNMANEKAVRENIEFTGLLSRQEIFKLMQRSKILVHPSKFEGSGFVFTEALVNGMNIVSFNVGYAQEHRKWFIAKNEKDFIQIAKNLLTTSMDYNPVNLFSLVETVERYAGIYGIN